MNEMITGKYSKQLTERVPWKKWEDYSNNPLIEPLYGDVVADPAVVTSEESPDKKWHMFVCATWNTIIHLTGDDGLNWTILEAYDWTGFSPFIFKDDNTFYLFYQRIDRLKNECCIACRHSQDLFNWSKRYDILAPTLPWEDQDFRATVRNACVVKKDEQYMLYYSGGVKILKDLGFEEPACIGIATSKSILGPYKKRETPILEPNQKDEWRNIGCGGMKVYYYDSIGLFIGFNNGIFIDENGHSRSALHMLVSEDGYEWFDLPDNPFLSPAPGWKDSLVYQVCVKEVGDKLWAYYNSREGWEKGIERIGLAFASKGEIK